MECGELVVFKTVFVAILVSGCRSEVPELFWRLRMKGPALNDVGAADPAH